MWILFLFAKFLNHNLLAESNVTKQIMENSQLNLRNIKMLVGAEKVFCFTISLVQWELAENLQKICIRKPMILWCPLGLIFCQPPRDIYHRTEFLESWISVLVVLPIRYILCIQNSPINFVNIKRVHWNYFGSSTCRGKIFFLHLYTYR